MRWQGEPNGTARVGLPDGGYVDLKFDGRGLVNVKDDPAIDAALERASEHPDSPIQPAKGKANDDDA